MKRRTGDTHMPLLDAPALDTRRAARDGIAPTADHMRGIVLRYLLDQGERGATDEQGAQATGIRPDTWRARRVELRDAGLVIDSGRRRCVSSGRQAAVWVAAAASGMPAPGRPERRSTRPAPAKLVDRRPTKPCYCCGSRAFWSHRLSPTVWLCATCRRPVDESHVAARFTVPEGPGVTSAGDIHLEKERN